MKRHSSNHSGSNTRLPGKEELIALSAKAAAEAGELSLSRLALNIPTLLYAEDGEEGAAERIFSGLREPVREIALAVSGHGEIPAEAKEKVFALREENTEKMRRLSVYADRFVIDEYILNRLEHRFDYFALPEDYSDEAFAGQILEALSAQKDQTARQPLLLAVLEQLPMRMTTSRFLQIVEDGLSVYAEADKSTIDQLFFLLRQTAFLDETPGQGNYPEFDRLADKFADFTPDELTADAFFSLREELADCMKDLDFRVDELLSRQELLNDLCVLCLFDSLPESEEASRCADCIVAALDLEGRDDAWESLMPKYTALEGLQERAIESFDRLSASVDEVMAADRAGLEETGLAPEFLKLSDAQKLLSSSRFAAINLSAAEEEMPDGYLGDLSTRFISDLSASFKSRPKMMNRAVMARLLTQLPAFLRSYEELESYIINSLSSCRVPEEKKAAYEIIMRLISES